MGVSRAQRLSERWKPRVLNARPIERVYMSHRQPSRLPPWNPHLLPDACPTGSALGTMRAMRDVTRLGVTVEPQGNATLGDLSAGVGGVNGWLGTGKRLPGCE